MGAEDQTRRARDLVVSLDSADLHLGLERHADVAVITVHGELDAYTAPRLEELCDHLHDDGVQSVELDLSETRFLDSSGLRALLGAHRRFEHTGGVRAVRPSEAVLRLFEITGLLEHFGLEPRERA